MLQKYECLQVNSYQPVYFSFILDPSRYTGVIHISHPLFFSEFNKMRPSWSGPYALSKLGVTSASLIWVEYGLEGSLVAMMALWFIRLLSPLLPQISLSPSHIWRREQQQNHRFIYSQPSFHLTVLIEALEETEYQHELALPLMPKILEQSIRFYILWGHHKCGLGVRFGEPRHALRPFKLCHGL